MKYGLVVYHKNESNYPEKCVDSIFNLGDNMQILATLRIYYERMGIKKEDIIHVHVQDLSTYDGEPVVLPINFFFTGCKGGKWKWFPTSRKIIPVFIGIHLETEYLEEEAVNYFKTYAPIGCRDAYTLQTMQKYRIPSYLFGCVTATLPMRSYSPKQNGKVFFVDEPKELLPYIPKYLLNNCVHTTHVGIAPFCNESFRENMEFAKKLLSDYYHTASLVITSRLHCAAPCIAMGIPVVLAIPEYSCRFSWLGKLVPLYTPEIYKEIDWEPKPVNYEAIKKQMEDIVVDRLQTAYSKWVSISRVSEFFESGVKDERWGREYVKPLDNIKQQICNLKIFESYSSYILWGITSDAYVLYAFLKETYPHVKLVAVVDEFIKMEFNGLQTITSSELANFPNTPIFVMPITAYPHVMKVTSELNDIGPIFSVYKETSEKK